MTTDAHAPPAAPMTAERPTWLPTCADPFCISEGLRTSINTLASISWREMPGGAARWSLVHADLMAMAASCRSVISPEDYTRASEAWATLDAERTRAEAAERRVRELEAALTRIAAIEPASNCDVGSMARARMRDIARAALAGRGA